MELRLPLYSDVEGLLPTPLRSRTSFFRSSGLAFL